VQKGEYLMSMPTDPLPIPPAPPRRFPRWLLALLIGIPVLCVCVIVAIGVLTLLGSRVQSATGPTTLVTSTDGHSEVMTPAGWSVQKDLNDKADLQVANPRAEQYLIVLTENKADLVDMTLEKYIGVTRDGFTAKLTDVKVSEPRTLTINGMSAIQYEISATSQNTRVVYWVTCVEGAKHFHQILAWTLASQADANRELLKQVVETFRETGK
jgi:hypothetical protein